MPPTPSLQRATDNLATRYDPSGLDHKGGVIWKPAIPHDAEWIEVPSRTGGVRFDLTDVARDSG